MPDEPPAEIDPAEWNKRHEHALHDNSNSRDVEILDENLSLQNTYNDQDEIHPDAIIPITERFPEPPVSTIPRQVGKYKLRSDKTPLYTDSVL